MSDEVFRYEIAKLELRKGDRLVVRTDQILSKDQVDRVRNMFKDIVPDYEVIVVSGGLTVEVLRPE